MNGGCAVQLVAATLPCALALALVGTLLVLGMRADRLASLTVAAFSLRLVLTGAAGVLGLHMALRLARPEGTSLVRVWPLAVILLLAAGAICWAWFSTPPGTRQMAVMAVTMVATPIGARVLTW